VSVIARLIGRPGIAHDFFQSIQDGVFFSVSASPPFFR